MPVSLGERLLTLNSGEAYLGATNVTITTRRPVRKESIAICDVIFFWLNYGISCATAFAVGLNND